MFQSKNKSYLPVLLLLLLLLGAISCYFKEPLSSGMLPALASRGLKPVIILDAGHGGKDPGKVSESGTLEKDINLSIVLKVKELLSSYPVTVILTRDSDKDLATEESDHKTSDLNNRIALIEKYTPKLVVSIHQNSYPDPSVIGAQCFYYKDSIEGEKLATLLQNHLIASTNQTKIREIKNNESYYLLKYSPATTAIVECGFLSSPAEEELLLSSSYQDQLAEGIKKAVLEYLQIPE